MTILDLNKRFRTYFNFNVPIDMVMTAVHGPQHAIIDVLKLDKMLSNHDYDYNPDKCTYKDQNNVSQSAYIILKYGKDAEKFVKDNMK